MHVTVTIVQQQTMNVLSLFEKFNSFISRQDEIMVINIYL